MQPLLKRRSSEQTVFFHIGSLTTSRLMSSEPSLSPSGALVEHNIARFATAAFLAT